MTVQMVHFTTTDGKVAEIEAAIESMIMAINRARPPGLRYGALKLADGVTFLLILELAEGIENPLPTIAEGRAFQQQMATWVNEPPRPQPVSVVGSYELFA